MSDTIYALSSGHGRGGVAVVRVSGFLADETLLRIAGKLPRYRHATLMELRMPETGALIDQALVLRFAGGHSFTGELTVEFQLHGGRAVVAAMLATLGKMDGLRPAGAGEFTRRAMENGKLDLLQVEALADLIDADTDLQRRQALLGMGGGLSERAKVWRDLLLDAKALIAAEIDFSDEGDVGEHAASGVDSVLERLEEELASVVASSSRGSLIREGCCVVIAGLPNAGKSTLLNALAGTDAAIVTEHAGTTRDIIEVRLDLDGMPVRLLDTAGLRSSVDPVERIGVGRAVDAIGRADVILLLDGGDGCPADLVNDPRSIRIRSKCDMRTAMPTSEDLPGTWLPVSVTTGHGMEALQKTLTEAVKHVLGAAEPAIVTQDRHRAALTLALGHCRAARRALLTGIEICDDEIRGADHALASLLGLIGVEEVLGAIFSRFCVGK